MSLDVNIINNSIQPFKNWDKQDGAEDGQIDLSKIKPAAAKNLKQKDYNKDQQIDFEEFILGTCSSFAPDSVPAMIKGIFSGLKKAGWDTKACNDFLTIICEGSGEGEFEKRLNEMKGLISVSSSIKLEGEGRTILEYYSGWQRKEGKLFNTILGSGMQPAGKLDLLRNTLMITTACLVYYESRQKDINIPREVAVSQLLDLLMQEPLFNTFADVGLFYELILSNPGPEKMLEKGAQSIKRLIKTINALDEREKSFLSMFVKSGKISSFEEFDEWAKIAREKKEVLERLFLFVPLLTLDVSGIDRLIRKLDALDSLGGELLLAALVQSESVNSLEELENIASASAFIVLNKEYMKKENVLNKHFIHVSSPINGRENDAILYFGKQLAEGNNQGIIDYIYKANFADISKEEGYRADEEVIEQTLNWAFVMENFGSGLENGIIQILQKELKNLKNDSSTEEVKAFFKKIPTRRILQEILSGEGGEKVRQWMTGKWQLIRPFLGHIFLGNDKREYYFDLAAQITEAGVSMGEPSDKPFFRAKIQIVNLETMEKKEICPLFVVLDKERVIVSLSPEKNGDYVEQSQAMLVNPRQPNCYEKVVRRIYGDLFKDFKGDHPYAVYYFPKIDFMENGKYLVSTNYMARDGNPENLIRKESSSSNSAPDLKKKEAAYEVFLKAFKREGAIYDAALKFWEKEDVGKTSRLKKEEYIEIKDLMNLLQIMDTNSCEVTASRVFKLTEKDLNDYKGRISGLLNSEKNLSPQEFLAKAIKACDGKVMLASLLCYNILWQNKDELMTRHPQTFRYSAKAGDPVGRIYHFFGTFFAAYSVQKCLVWRYHHDKVFKAEIDGKVANFKKQVKIDLNAGSVSGISPVEFLMYIQYRQVQMGDESLKEMVSLAGIFKEEVYEDGEVSEETYRDMLGAGSAHAFFSRHYGVELIGELRDSMVRIWGDEVLGRKKGFYDEYQLAILLGIPLEEIIKKGVESMAGTTIKIFNFLRNPFAGIVESK